MNFASFNLDVLWQVLIALLILGGVIARFAEQVPLFHQLPPQGKRVSIFLVCVGAPFVGLYIIGNNLDIFLNRTNTAFALAAGLVVWLGSQVAHDANLSRALENTDPTSWQETFKKLVQAFAPKPSAAPADEFDRVD